MKKFFLFAMLCIVSVLGMRAQTWTGSEPAAGDFYLYNVGAAKFLNAGDRAANWGTNACLSANYGLDFTLEVNGTGYNLNSKNSNGGNNNYLGTSLWTDGAASAWTFTSVGDKVYNISQGTSYLAANTAGDDVEIANSGDADNAKWILVSRENVIAAMASATQNNPINISFLLGAPDFSRNDTRARNGNSWSWTNSGGNVTVAGPNDQRGTYGCEFWNNTFDIYQTLTDMPDGTYEFKIAGYGTNGTTYIYANNTEVLFANTTSASNFDTALNNIADGQFTGNTTGQFVVSGGTVKVGVKRTTNKSYDWTVFDNAELYYYGLDLSEFAAALQAAVNAAEAVNGTVPTAAYNALAAVVTEQNKDYTTTADYNAATNAIIEATNTAKALQPNYARYKEVRTAALALDDDATIFTGNATINVADADAAVEAATTVDGINSAIAMIRTAAANFLGAVTVNQGKSFNITNIFLNNADFSAGNINGWETNYVSGQQAVNIGYQGASYTNTYTEGEGDDAVTITATISQFIEAWRWSPALGDGYLRQTVSGLPEGKYTLECDAIAADQPGGTMPTGAYVYINAAGVDYKTTMATENEKPKHFTAQFLSPGSVDVTFGMKTESTTANWIGADNFTVKFYGIDLTPYATLLAEAVSEAQALQDNIPTAAYTELNSVVTANNKAWNTSAQYTTAIANIQEATATAKALQTNYTRYKNIRTEALAIAPNTNVTNANSQANAATTNEGIEAAIVTLRAALITELPNVTIPAAGFIDVTAALIDNASVRQNVDGWTVSDVVRMDQWGTGPTTNFEETEFYHSNFKFYQLLSLGTGTWEFGVTGFHRAGNHNTNFYAGDSKILIPGVENTVVNTMEQAKTYFDDGNGKVALKFFIENGQDVEVGIDNQDTETDRWTIFRDFTLKYYGPENAILEGDLDGNGEVNATDLSMLVDYLLGKHVEGLAVDPGTVTLKDVTKLVNIIKKK